MVKCFVLKAGIVLFTRFVKAQRIQKWFLARIIYSTQIFLKPNIVIMFSKRTKIPIK